ncbi:MAG TPA: methionine synthase [Streptosporangiaceae bacterium]
MQDISAAGAAPFAWPAGSATGAGSMPGISPAEAMAVITGELPDFPHLAELPGRGAGADMIGRTAALLVDLPVETTPRGWRFAARPGRDQRRAADLLEADLDAAQQAAEDYAGPFKIQLAGPWTMAASVELSRSQDPALADPGAVDDLIASLAEGVAAHVSEVRKRIPGAQLVLQLDEPALPAVAGGAVPTASGLNRVGPVDHTAASAGLAAMWPAGTALTLVHCCARGIPFGLIKESRAGGLGFDLSQLRRGDEEGVAELAEAGLAIFAGALNTHKRERVTRPAPVTAREIARHVIELWHQAGMPAGRLAGQVVITPACGLAGFTPEAAAVALACCREAARIMPEMAQEGTQ